jgi:hypothetical protein
VCTYVPGAEDAVASEERGDDEARTSSRMAMSRDDLGAIAAC